MARPSPRRSGPGGPSARLVRRGTSPAARLLRARAWRAQRSSGCDHPRPCLSVATCVGPRSSDAHRGGDGDRRAAAAPCYRRGRAGERRTSRGGSMLRRVRVRTGMMMLAAAGAVATIAACGPPGGAGGGGGGPPGGGGGAPAAARTLPDGDYACAVTSGGPAYQAFLCRGTTAGGATRLGERGGSRRGGFAPRRRRTGSRRGRSWPRSAGPGCAGGSGHPPAD